MINIAVPGTPVPVTGLFTKFIHSALHTFIKLLDKKCIREKQDKCLDREF